MRMLSLVYVLIQISFLAIAPVRAQNINSEDLRFHLPVIKKEAGIDDVLHLFAPLPTDHLGRREWSPVFGWHAWRRHANNSGVTVDRWDRSLVVQPWEDGTVLLGGFRVGPRLNGFVGFYSGGQVGLGAPWWTTDLNHHQWFYRWDNHSPPSTQRGEGFFPQDSFTWFDGIHYRLNIFGLNFADSTPTQHFLREYYRTGTGWAWTDHGIPPSRAKDRFNPNNIKMGPNSAIWDPEKKIGWVFVAANKQPGPYFATDQEVFYRYYHPTQAPNWRWETLGRPFANSPSSVEQVVDIQPPMAVSREEDGKFKIHLFVVMAITTTRHSVDPDAFDARWELWERHYDGIQWHSWVRHGALPGGHVRWSLVTSA